jgi:hypothetical protein
MTIVTTFTQEATEFASKAINEAFEHYFVNLASGDEKIHEAKFVAELIQNTQPWLFFTEESMEALVNSIYKDVLYINFIYTMTAIFKQRYVGTTQHYEEYVGHIAESFNVQDNSDENLSMMSRDYRDRLVKPEGVRMMLQNNRMLVMIVSLISYLDTNILAQALGGVK